MLKSEAHVFALIPKDSHHALIIRRGPSKKVGIFHWNIKNDQVKLGQWLNGRVYEYFSDISDDGKHWIYSANQKGRGYTAIARSPYLKALTLWDNVGGYGGGKFLSTNSFMLFDGRNGYQKFRNDNLKQEDNDFVVGKDSVYYRRMIERGWNETSSNLDELIFHKMISKSITIEKKITRENYTETESYSIIYPDDSISTQWNWCESINKNLYWSERGILYKSIKPKSMEDNNRTIQIHDFNEESFETIVAPY